MKTTEGRRPETTRARTSLKGYDDDDDFSLDEEFLRHLSSSGDAPPTSTGRPPPPPYLTTPTPTPIPHHPPATTTTVSKRKAKDPNDIDIPPSVATYYNDVNDDTCPRLSAPPLELLVGENPLAEFVGVVSATDAMSPELAMPYLEVVAPTTLPEGYTFEAEANGHSFTVRVPVGGVEAGQKFSVPFFPGSNGYSGCAIPRASVPVGHWKDGLCDCFRLGFIHAVVWNACCFPFILLGQVMHRLKLTWLGGEANHADGSSMATFRILAMIAAIDFCISWVLYFTSFVPLIGGALGNSPTEIEESQFLTNLLSLLNFAFTILLVVIMARARIRIRSRYGIPERTCHGGEDCCCAFWCSCCTISQMARHTADYENYPARCCSETGLSPNAPLIV